VVAGKEDQRRDWYRAEQLPHLAVVSSRLDLYGFSICYIFCSAEVL
jgi:hypothetical protein